METNLKTSPRLTFLGYGACFIAGCLWGTGFYFSRLALNEMSVDYMVLYRILFACLGVLPLALLSRWRFSGAELRTLLLSAAFGIPISCLIQFSGLARTTVSHASLMVGAMPVMLGVAATLFAGERLDRIGWLALCGSTLGAALLTMGGSHGAAGRDQPSLTGDLLVLVSLLAALAWILLSKKLMLTHSPSVVSAYTILIGGAMLLPWALGPWLLTPLTHAKVSPPPFAAISLDRMGSAGLRRPALHGHHHTALELGHPSRARLARRSLSEHRAGPRLLAGRPTARRTPGRIRMGRRRPHPGGGHHPDHPRPRA